LKEAVRGDALLRASSLTELFKNAAEIVMVTMVTRRLLEAGDFDAWKKRFEAGAADRKAAGCLGVQRYQGTEDPRELVVIFEWDTVERARAYVGLKESQNPDLTAPREDGGGPKLDVIFVQTLGSLDS
jgi:heme-degrading monooxygenase HmoA